MRPALMAAVFAVSSLAALDADARSRVSLLAFEGDSARPLRWRVAQILRRAGHTVLGFAPPRNPDSTRELSAYAKRRRVDVFVIGSAVEEEDGWKLSLSLRGEDGERLGKPLTFTASTLRGLVQELKGDGQERLGRAVTLGAAAEPAEDDVADTATEIDADEPAAKSTRKSKKKKKRKSRAAEVEAEPEPTPPPREINLDDPTQDESPVDEAAGEDVDAWGRASGTRAKTKRGKSDAEASEPAPLDIDRERGDTAAPPAAEPEVEDAESWSSARDGSASETEAPSETSQSSADEADSSPSISSDSESGEVGVDEDSSGSEGGASKKRWPTLMVGAGAGLVYRNLTYVDNLYGRLREPTTNSVAYKLDAVLYPFARPAKDRLALVVRYESTFSGDVKDPTLGKSFAVAFSEIAGGMRYRQPLGAHEILAQTTIGRLSSGLDDPAKESRIPAIDYTLVRPSLALGLSFGDISMRGEVGYRLPIGGFGEVSSVEYFPRMDGYGVDSSAGLRYRFSDEVSFDLSAEVRRFVLNMNSQPDDAVQGQSEVAGGAVDLYVSGYFGLALTF